MADNGHFCVFILVLGAGNKSVKVALILPILNDTVFLKFTLGKGFCNGRCYFSFMMQHFFLVKPQKRIQPCDPILHIHDVSTTRLPLGIIKIHGGLHGLTSPIAIWNAPGERNALTTAATPHGSWMRSPPSTRVLQHRRWSARESSLTVAN